MITAFQSNVFQNNAFQIGVSRVGWFNEWNRHDPEELERRLKAQRGFGLKEYEALLAAQAAALEAAEKAETEKQKRALEEAAHAAQELVDNALSKIEARPVPQINALIAALNAAAGANRASASIKHAELTTMLARNAYYKDEDEDEALLLLQ